MAWRQLLPQASSPTDRVNPVEEHVSGEEYNLPYRGMEHHGVEPNAKPVDVPDYDDEHEGYVPLPPIHDQDPIPVKVVTDGARELRRWRVYQTTVPLGTTVNIAGRNERRISIQIRNQAASGFIWFAPEIHLAQAFGFPVSSRGVLQLSTEDPIYVYADTVDTLVCVLEEYAVTEQ